MFKSPLQGFDYRSVDDIINEGVDMVYDYNNHMNEGGEFWGTWLYEKSRVYISPDIIEKKVEDITIVHEWLHAYETIILETQFSDSQIDWWAHFHLRKHRTLADYIRGFFPEFEIR